MGTLEIVIRNLLSVRWQWPVRNKERPVMKQPSQWFAGEKNVGGEYAARAVPREEKPAGLKNKRKQATTERNRGAETGASNSKRSSIPTATK